jgi:ubiquinone/menaquinone biosynthesis C-methylase UbiE
MTDTQTSYDRVAAEYTARIADELSHKPFDRKMLDWLHEKAGAGLICDMGCGPGHIAAYLQAQGADVCGIDLSPGMIEQAQARNPNIPFTVGDMMDLAKVSDASYSGIAAFYTLIHLTREQMPTAMRELWRVLKPGGVILATFHIGQETRHFDEFFGAPVNLDFIFFETHEIRAFFEGAGFSIEEAAERDPYPEIEVQTRRGYVFARKV